MYSQEIHDYLKERKWVLQSYGELQKIKNCSSQIDRIRFDNIGDRYSKYYIHTTDNFEWYVYIKNYNVDYD